MTVLASKNLIVLFQYNQNIIHEQLKDITHAESLLQPPFQGNCINWVIGHILWSRDICLDFFALPGMLTEDEKKVFGYGSEPLIDIAKASDLDTLVKRLDLSLDTLSNKLIAASQEELDREIKTWRGLVSLCETLFIMQNHEAYHTGQLELLRQLTGKNDHVL